MINMCHESRNFSRVNSGMHNPAFWEIFTPDANNSLSLVDFRSQSLIGNVVFCVETILLVLGFGSCAIPTSFDQFDVILMHKCTSMQMTPM